MSAKIVFVEEIANDEKSFVGKSVRVLGRVKKVNGRERKLYITNATDSWLTAKKRKEDALDSGHKSTILVSTVDVQPNFQFKKSMLYTFIGEFVFTDPSSNVSLPGSSTVVETKVDTKTNESASVTEESDTRLGDCSNETTSDPTPLPSSQARVNDKEDASKEVTIDDSKSSDTVLERTVKASSIASTYSDSSMDTSIPSR